MKKNEKKSWTGRFITKSGSTVSEEPPFSLEDMFSGRKLDQNPVEERLKPVLHFTRKFRVEGEPFKGCFDDYGPWCVSCGD